MLLFYVVFCVLVTIGVVLDEYETSNKFDAEDWKFAIIIIIFSSLIVPVMLGSILNIKINDNR